MRRSAGRSRTCIASGEIGGKPNELAVVHAKDRPYHRVALIGLGDREKYTPGALAKLAGTAVRNLGKRNVAKLAFVLPAEAAADPLLAASAVAEGAIAATIDTTTYRTEPDRPVDHRRGRDPRRIARSRPRSRPAARAARSSAKP